MRKMSNIAAVVALFTASSAMAGTVNFFFATTSDRNAAVPGNPTLYVSPGGDALQNCHTNGSLYLYMDVTCRGSGVGDQIIAAQGLNIAKSGAGAVTATAFQVYNTPGDTGATSGPWSPPSPNAPVLNGANVVTNSRAVAVPASQADPLWNGYQPNVAAGGCTAAPVANYRTARLDVTGVTAGDISLFLQVGALKITRVYRPTTPNGGTPETVGFGTGDADVGGSTPGAQSANADAFISVRKKGDVGSIDQNTGEFCSAPDGLVDTDDLNSIFEFINNGIGAAYGGSCTGNLSVADYIAVADVGSIDQNTGEFCAPTDGLVDNDDLNSLFEYVNGGAPYGGGCTACP